MTMALQYINDKAYITRGNLTKLLKISRQQMIAYEKKDNPLRRADIDKKTIHYDLLYALKWHASEIDHKYRIDSDNLGGVASSSSSGDDEEYQSGDKITSKNMRIAKDLEAAENEKIKRIQGELDLKIKRGQYIPSEISDKSTAQIVRLMLTGLQNVKDSMPNRLIECKTIDELRDTMDNEFDRLVMSISATLEKHK